MSHNEILREFLLETHENLALLDADLIRLEKNPAEKQTLAEVFRTLHSIKGTAGFMGLDRLQTIAHAAESLLSRLRAGEIVFQSAIATALLRVVDAIREILANIESTGGEGTGDYSALVAEVDRLRETSQPPAETPPQTASLPPASAVTLAEPVGLFRSPATAPQAVAPPTASAPPVTVANPPAAPTHVPPPAPPTVPPAVPPATATPSVAAPTLSSAATIAFAVASVPPVAAPVPAAVAPVPTVAAPVPAVAPPGSSGSAELGGADLPEVRSGSVADTAIRVDVGLLDKLMTLVGELVLARNQILQHSELESDGSVLGAVQRLNRLTTELQASVMKTRMQPVGNVLNKFPRVVRDLALACGKKVRFEMEGQDTELDKTLIEAIRDPLTHLIRNAVDHGIEAPEVRQAQGKPPEGRLRMAACHEGGKVIIEIADDGAGIDLARVRQKALDAKLVSPEVLARMTRQDLLALIFLPGFSTSDRVTQFSGRGVGMDVVRTNIEKIGGTVDIESTPGQGTTIRTKIPLTLAIIPALIIGSGGERFAIPQVSLLELVRLDAEQAPRSIEQIQGTPVYRLRGALLPLVFLDRQLQLESTRGSTDDLHIVVLQADEQRFGLVVDTIRDTEEIVVKPLQKQLKGVPVFAGAAIMGDGRVALVLDVVGLAQRAGVIAGGKSRALAEHADTPAPAVVETHSLLLFTPAAGGQMAIPLSQVARLEEFSRSQLESLGDQLVVQYRGEILPLVDVSRELARLAGSGTSRLPTDTAALPASETLPVVVYADGSQRVGLVVGQILDIVHDAIAARSEAHRPGALFTAIVQDKVTEFVDVAALLRAPASPLTNAHP